MSSDVTYEAFANRFPGDDERVDVALRSHEAARGLARHFVGEPGVSRA